MKSKIDLLLIVRGILAVSVLVWHMEGYKEVFPHILNIPGRTAVWIFFGISGYVMGYGFFKKKYFLTLPSLKLFYRARFFRIYPLFISISFISALFFYLNNQVFPIHSKNILKELFMLQYNHEYQLSGVFWTLGIEVQYYLIAPIMAYFMDYFLKNKWLLGVVIYFGLFSLVPFSTYYFGTSLDSRNLLGNLSHFFVGMLACRWVLHSKKSIPIGIGIILLFLLLISSNYIYHVKQVYYYLIGHIFIDLIILILIFLHQTIKDLEVNDKFKIIQFLTYTGVISYGVYAWHPLILNYLPENLKSLWIVFLATWTTSYLSFRFFEEKIIKWNKKYE